MKSALKKSLFFLLLMALLLIGCSLPAFGENADELYVTDGITLDCRDFAPHTEEGDAESRWIGTNAECFLSGFLTEKGKSGFVSIGDGVLSVGGNVFGSGEYTVELVVVPTGKIDPETGKRLNTKTMSPETSESLFAEGYSSYSPVAFSLGKLKGAAYTSLGFTQEDMAVYWFFNGEKEYRSWDNYFASIGENEPVTYSISLCLEGEGTAVSALYRMQGNGYTVSTVSLNPEEYVGNPGGNMLFMQDFPCRIYAVRVYNRVLTAQEQAQNHFADICHLGGISPENALKLLSREEQEDLFTLCAHLPLTAKEHVEDLISRFLYGKEIPGVDESLLSFFAGQSLNICPLTYREDADLLCRKAKELLVGKERSQDAVRSIWQGILNNADFTQSCVVFDGISFLGETVPSFRADFSVNPYYLSLLEETYNVKMGALVGLTEYYSDYASLTLQTAKEHSVICRAYQTGDAASEDFSLHVVWDEPVQNKTGYKHKVTVRGFLSLTDKVTQNTETVYFDVKDAHVSELSIFSLASYYVKQYDGLKADMVAYSRDETLLSVLRASNIIGFPDYASEEEIKLSFLQKDLADGLAEALAVSEVRYCGEKYENYDTPAIWVQYLGDNYASDSRVRPAYIYFPGKYDPTAGSSTVNTMLSKGIKRVFCFIGIPVGIKGEKFPGIVCVHGGGGHAYGQYVLEAVNHGYAAIAIDTDGYTKSVPTSGACGSADYAQDVLAPAQKDALTVEGYDGEIENHWMYQVQKSLIFANTVLRSHPSVKEDQVGITGISWGGFGMSIAICYDARYAFGIPVYISANTDDSQTRSLNNLYQNPFLAALWQNDELLKQVSMPVLVINSDMDLYTSVDVSAMTAGMVQNGKVCIIHKLSHSQQQGAALSEIYLFADEVLGISHRLPELTRQPSAESGHSFTLEIKENAELSEYRATLYYLNNPVTCLNHAANADSFLAEEWNEVPLLIDGEKIKVELPETVAVYYIQLSAFNEKESKVKDVYTGITYGNDGRITVSTDLVSSFPGMFCE